MLLNITIQHRNLFGQYRWGSFWGGIGMLMWWPVVYKCSGFITPVISNQPATMKPPAVKKRFLQSTPQIRRQPAAGENTAAPTSYLAGDTTTAAAPDSSDAVLATAAEEPAKAAGSPNANKTALLRAQSKTALLRAKSKKLKSTSKSSSNRKYRAADFFLLHSDTTYLLKSFFPYFSDHVCCELKSCFFVNWKHTVFL